MLRCSRDNRHPAPCNCLLEAYRKFPRQTDFAIDCASPSCPVRSLDSATLHQFLEAIGGPGGGAGKETGGPGDRSEMSIFRSIVRRLRRRKSELQPGQQD